jgi:hypothetical protein
MDASDLIAHGRGLIPAHRGAAKQVALRRAVSAAYYALFHAFLRAAADDLIGKTGQARRSRAYRLLYRGFEHSAVKRVCREAGKTILNENLAKSTGLRQFPESLQIAARGLVLLQDKRHEADYEPVLRLTKSDARVALLMAEHCIAALNAADNSLRRIFLMSMLFSPR